MLDKVAATVLNNNPSSDLPISFDDVSFAAGPLLILDRVTLTLKPGPPTILLGPNGAGKTTLLRLAKGLIVPTAGRIHYAGRLAPTPGRHAIVFQKPVMLRRTVAANIAFALQTAARAATPQAIDALLDLVGLAELGARPARRLSGGEQQRLALARALARDPQVLFLDEPTASLDPASTKAVEDIIARVATGGVKVVMATHDLGQARRLAGDIVFLAKRRLLEHAPATSFFIDPATDEARRFLAGDLVL